MSEFAGFVERLAREACIEGLGHQHIGVERAVAAAIRAALDEAAAVARACPFTIKTASSVQAYRDEAAAAIEALKGESEETPR